MALSAIDCKWVTSNRHVKELPKYYFIILMNKKHQHSCFIYPNHNKWFHEVRLMII